MSCLSCEYIEQTIETFGINENGNNRCALAWYYCEKMQKPIKQIENSITCHHYQRNQSL